MRRGVGEAEAAGIRGNAHVHRLRQRPVGLDAHQLQHVPHHLGAGGAVPVHKLLLRKGGRGAVMVDAQGDFPQQRPEVRRQHLGRRHVHRDDGVAFLCPGLGQPLVEPGKPGRHLFIFQHMGGFAQLPKPPA